jgi:hypothetical protein
MTEHQQVKEVSAECGRVFTSFNKMVLPVKHNFLLLYLMYNKYNNKKLCLTGKDHFIEFCKHSGMVNTKFKGIYLL